MVVINAIFLLGTLATCITTVLSVSVIPRDEPKIGYLGIIYKEDTEQINAILSNGNSAIEFSPLNNGNPILLSGVGTKHTRDPFLVRDKVNKKNFIIATDNGLKEGGYNFDKASRAGSRSITIYESIGDSLTEWNPARLSPHLVNRMFGAIGSPEAVWDDKASKWLVTFTGNMFDEKTDKDKKGPAPPSQIWSVYTNDFKTFTKATIYLKIDGGGASDMTIAHITGDTWVRFFRNDTNQALKVQGQVSNNGLGGNWKDIQGDHPFVNSKSANGGPLIFADNLNPKHFYVWVDDFAVGYVPYESDDITQGNYKAVDAPNFIKNIKQGSITPVTQSEYDVLKNAGWPLGQK